MEIDKYYKPDLNALAESIVQWRRDKGFVTNRENVMEKLMLVVTELADAAEEYRHDPTLTQTKTLDNFTEEIADAYIRLLDLTGSLGIDIAIAIHNKMLVNEKRPHKHGKQL